jgi:hypothetical protein
MEPSEDNIKKGGIENLSLVRNNKIVAGEVECNVEVWDWRICKKVCSFGSSLVFGGGHRLAINVDESIVAVASWDLGIELFNLSGQMVKRLPYFRFIHEIQFSDFDRDCLFVNSESGLMIVNLVTEEFTVYNRKLSNFRQSNNDHELLVCESKSRKLSTYNYYTQIAKGIFTFGSFAILDISVRNEFILLAEATEYLKSTGRATFLDTNGKLLNEIIPRDHDGHFFRLSLSDDNKTFFAVMWQVKPEVSYYLQELDVVSGKIIREINIGSLRFAEFSQDNKFLIVDTGEMYSLEDFNLVNQVGWN